LICHLNYEEGIIIAKDIDSKFKQCFLFTNDPTNKVEKKLIKLNSLNGVDCDVVCDSIVTNIVNSSIVDVAKNALLFLWKLILLYAKYDDSFHLNEDQILELGRILLNIKALNLELFGPSSITITIATLVNQYYVWTSIFHDRRTFSESVKEAGNIKIKRMITGSTNTMNSSNFRTNQTKSRII